MELVSAATDLDEDQVLNGLEAAAHRALVTEALGRPGSFRLAHAMIRQVIHHRLGPTQMRAVPAPRKYPSELRERATRLVAEARQEDRELSLTAAVKRIATRVGIVPDILRGWCPGRGRRRAAAGDHGRGRGEDAVSWSGRAARSSAPTRSCWRPSRSSRQCSPAKALVTRQVHR
jgi:transposase-like protein